MRVRLQWKAAGGLVVLGLMLGIIAACETTPPPPDDPERALVEKGRQIFFNETFDGNGRTCASCHRAEVSFGIDANFIATLPPDDPLFVAEFNPALKENFENPRLMREFALFVENLDGFDDLANNFVMRGVPHLLALRTRMDSPQGPRTGWSGDGAPGDGTLRSIPDYPDGFAAALAGIAGTRRQPPPTDALIQVFGPARTYPTVSYYQALDPDNFLPEGTFRDRVVLVGLSLQNAPSIADGGADAFATSDTVHSNKLVSGVEMQATIYDNLAHDLFIQAGLRGIGYNVLAMDVPDNDALQYGREYGNRGQCNPTYFTVGNLVKYLTYLRDEQKIPVKDIVANYVNNFGTPEQKKQWLPGMVSGDIVGAISQVGASKLTTYMS